MPDPVLATQEIIMKVGFPGTLSIFSLIKKKPSHQMQTACGRSIKVVFSRY